MKHVYLAPALLFCLQASAQITIDNNDMPVVNDTVRYSYALGIGSADQHLTGPNYLWDYSFLTPAAQERITFEAATAIPFVVTATYGVLNPSPDSIPGFGPIPTDFYDYFKNGSSGFRQVGSSFDFGLQFPIPIVYSSADYVYRFPLQAGNVDSCDSNYGFSIPGIGYMGMDRHRVNNVDGWGTLITPFGTFQTLRVRSVVDQTDTLSFDTTGQQGFSIVRPTLIQYKWLGQNSLTPLLQVDAQILFNNEVITGVTYQDSLRDSVFQVSVPELIFDPKVDVFPNPSSSSAFIRYELKQPASVSFRLFDVNGREALQLGAGRKSAGVQLQALDVSALAPGIYLLQIQAGETAIMRRICKQ